MPPWQLPKFHIIFIIRFISFAPNNKLNLEWQDAGTT